jgi:acetyl-CoA carboxylase biotin carboxyl carrier protein
MHGGRRFRRSLDLKLKPAETAGTFALHVPQPGVLRGLPRGGAVLGPGEVAAELEILGELVALIVPAGARGAVRFVAGDHGAAKVPVQAGQRIIDLDETLTGVASAVAHAGEGPAAAAGLVFRAPIGGRYYARPTPGEPPFVVEGAEIATGSTVALLEVMKTFHRVRFGGGELPERARVLRVVPRDGDDVLAGDPLLELAPS